MIHVDDTLAPADLLPAIGRFWTLSARKLRAIEASRKPGEGAPVFTVRGRYTARGWTEWTQGFQFGSALLQFDATGDDEFLELGRSRTIERMAPHLTHFGVHDHGFNTVSTYGALLRLMNEGRIREHARERDLYELAIKVSGAVQARRWTPIQGGGGGFIHSFNGPHSLFVDTIRTLRVLALAHLLGHELLEEDDRRVSLFDRLAAHARTTAAFSVYYGKGRDAYDVRGRTAHECLFNVSDGGFRCPSTQQGYSPFSTWTRGLAWAMLGFSELYEFVRSTAPGEKALLRTLRKGAEATCDFYIENTPVDGIPYWDTGAPGLSKLGDYLDRPADPGNPHEPVDSSAAAIACQGLLRTGNLTGQGRYTRAGLTVLRTLLGKPYLSAAKGHQGLVLHSVYHRPNGWDHVPRGSTVPRGESSMWGDYHAREAVLMVGRAAKGENDYTFYGS
jgi:rhamnogalacturonyl hydrolase YesR